MMKTRNFLMSYAVILITSSYSAALLAEGAVRFSPSQIPIGLIDQTNATLPILMWASDDYEFCYPAGQMIEACDEVDQMIATSKAVGGCQRNESGTELFTSLTTVVGGQEQEFIKIIDECKSK